MELKEITEKKNLIYNGKIFKIYNDTVILPNKEKSQREILVHNGGAVILVIDKNNDIYFVEQFRYAINKTLLELPAGKIDLGENPKNTAYREMEEELGLKAKEIISLGEISPTCGYSSEIIYMYYATDFEITKQNLDENEFLNIKKIPLKKVIKMIDNNEIIDAKTITTLYKYLIKTNNF